MPEYEGFKIVCEVIVMPKGKWSIMIEIIRRQDGKVMAARHNPFPAQVFDTKLEALDHVNRHVAAMIADVDVDADVDPGRQPGVRRIA